MNPEEDSLESGLLDATPDLQGFSEVLQSSIVEPIEPQDAREADATKNIRIDLPKEQEQEAACTSADSVASPTKKRVSLPDSQQK